MNINENQVPTPREASFMSSLPQIPEERKEQKISKATLDYLSNLNVSLPNVLFDLSQRATSLSREIEKNDLMISRGNKGLLIGLALCVCSLVATIFGRFEVGALNLALAFFG
ncbi:MAG: hypothetical protein H0W50_04475 [Parachlamydiaceae bacterium]|nr:hypothetical protein [Parachlamydiaceae bacterium]